MALSPFDNKNLFPATMELKEGIGLVQQIMEKIMAGKFWVIGRQ